MMPRLYHASPQRQDDDTRPRKRPDMRCCRLFTHSEEECYTTARSRMLTIRRAASVYCLCVPRVYMCCLSLPPPSFFFIRPSSSSSWHKKRQNSTPDETAMYNV